MLLRVQDSWGKKESCIGICSSSIEREKTGGWLFVRIILLCACSRIQRGRDERSEGDNSLYCWSWFGLHPTNPSVFDVVDVGMLDGIWPLLLAAGYLWWMNGNNHKAHGTCEMDEWKEWSNAFMRPSLSVQDPGLWTLNVFVSNLCQVALDDSCVFETPVSWCTCRFYCAWNQRACCM